MTSIQVTDRAARRINEIVSGEPSGTMLRVSVESGGCTGFQYNFDLVREREDDDIAIEKEGVTVLIDETSHVLLQGSEIDFVDDLIGAAFKIKNPNAAETCGCGVSFSV